MKTIYAASLLMLLTSCIASGFNSPAKSIDSSTAVSAPQPFVGAIENDPDVIWTIQAINHSETSSAEGDAISGSYAKREADETRYALFACYRRPKTDPGPPTCYLAKVSATKEDLMWPEALGFSTTPPRTTGGATSPATTRTQDSDAGGTF
jgi:hypothetical protein